VVEKVDFLSVAHFTHSPFLIENNFYGFFQKYSFVHRSELGRTAPSSIPRRNDMPIFSAKGNGSRILNRFISTSSLFHWLPRM